MITGVSRQTRNLFNFAGLFVLLALSVFLSSDTQLRTAIKPQTSPTTHQELVTNANYRAYTISMGGLLDQTNTSDHRYDQVSLFEPNISLKIENLGEESVKNPRIMINDQHDWGSLEALIASLISPGMSDEDKALAIFNLVLENRYHFNPAEGKNETHDPVRLLNIYGYGICDDAAAVLSALWQAAGLQVRTWNLQGHVVSEVWYDGAYHILDADAEVIYPLADNLTLGGYDDIIANPYWAQRAHHYGRYASQDALADAAHAALYGIDDVLVERNEYGHNMAMTLRPGESFEWRWNNIGKYHDNLDQTETPPYYANGKWVYTPDLNNNDFRGYLAKEDNITTKKDDGQSPKVHLAIPGKPGRIILTIESPYVIVGGTVKAEFVLDQPGDAINVFAYTSKDYGQVKDVWSTDQIGLHVVSFSLDDFIAPLSSDAKYQYFLEVQLESVEGINVGLNYLSLETDVQMSPFSLPALVLGENQVVYTDGNTAPHQILITHRWQENSNTHPPLPPLAPIFPADGSEIENIPFRFEWQSANDPDGDAITAYHILLGNQSDMTIPLSSNFDRVLDSNTYEIPWSGLLTTGVRYYWRVRARDNHAVWSDWSETWSFTPR